MMMIGIKTGTMATSVIQGTVRPRGTWFHVPRTYGCDDATMRAKGTKQYAKNVFVMNIIIINYYFICNETHTHPQNTYTHTHTYRKKNL